MDFNTVFTDGVNDEWHMWRYKLHPPHLINIATLPCETLNSENVIPQWDITKENDISNVSHMLHRNGPVDYKIWGVMQQRIQYETKICDIDDLQKCLDWLWTERYRRCNWSMARPSEMMCACWWRTLWTHAVKLVLICIMWFIRTFYETVNVIWFMWWLFCS